MILLFLVKTFGFIILQYMTDGVLLRETLKDSDLDKYRYGGTVIFIIFF